MLTKRESEVLNLLATPTRRSHVELLISAATVKKHTVSLYRKLHVGNRREALEKDQALDYLNE